MFSDPSNPEKQRLLFGQKRIHLLIGAILLVILLLLALIWLIAPRKGGKSELPSPAEENDPRGSVMKQKAG